MSAPEPSEADYAQAMEECEARIPGEVVVRRAYEIAEERAAESVPAVLSVPDAERIVQETRAEIVTSCDEEPGGVSGVLYAHLARDLDGLRDAHAARARMMGRPEVWSRDADFATRAAKRHSDGILAVQALYPKETS